jgi:type IV pilus assembly protein PilY1
MRTFKYFGWLGSVCSLHTKQAFFGLLALASCAVFAQPAQEPLLTRSTPVQPNLLYILDTSGSMRDDFIYSQAFRSGTGACGDLEIRNSSPYVNFLYYDPRKRYRPGRTNTGGVGTNAVIQGTSRIEVYLPNGWDSAPPFSTAGSFNPTTSTSRSDICDRARYVRYEVTNEDKFFRGGVTNATATEVATNPFGTKNVRRTDCAGTVCTVTEERQNIANWRAFHRTRQLAARTGSGEAFANVPETFRFSYGTIFATAPANFPVIREFPLARDNFYTWINGLGANGVTPLRSALNAAGRYYQQTTNTGPWGSRPWDPPSGETSASHVSCRRNFAIMVTDGEWNGGIPATAEVRLDVDGVNGPPITAHPNGSTYGYVPRSRDLRSVGKTDRTAGTNFADTLADVGMYYWVNDLRPDLTNNVSPGGQTDPAFWQHMTVYTAAFGVNGFLNTTQIAEARLGTRNWLDAQPVDLSTNTVDDLVHTAHNTGGRFLELTDADSFTSELGKAISEIADQQFSQAGVAASAVSLSAGTKKFVPTYNPSSWWGNLRAFNLDARGAQTGLAWEVVTTVNGKPTGDTTIPTPNSREIYTFVDRTASTPMIEFKRTNLATNGLIASSASDNTGTKMIDTTNNDLVEYLRGVRTREGNGLDDFRKRETILGDIANSTPAFVKDFTDVNYGNLPTGILGAASWNTYASTKASREGLLFVGANDGMVHVFREGTTAANQGSEVLAFVPRSVLGKLHLLARKPYTHQYYVDGPMSQHDAYITAPRNNAGGTRTGWFNLVAGSSGAGARNVFMMNASDGASMTFRNYMWEINHTMTGFENLGHVMAPVQMGVTQDGTWVAVFNNGPYGNDRRAYLFVVNLSTGDLIRAIPTDTLNNNGLGGVRLVRDTNGVITGAYAGDLRGRMWRFNMGSTNSADWTASRLYTAFVPSSTTDTQPITAAPSAFKRNDGKAGYIVTFGTGKLFDSTDQTSTSVQTVYGIWDNTEFTLGTAANGIDGRSLLVETSVVQVTSTTSGTSTQGSFNNLYDTTQTRNIDWDTDRGWYMNLNLALGQRLVYPVESLSGAVRVDSIAPRLNPQACESSASLGYNFILSPLAGKCFNQAIFDTNNDGRVDNSDIKACGYDTESDGQDVVLTRPGPQCTTPPVSSETPPTSCLADNLCCLIKTGKFSSSCTTVLSSEDYKSIDLKCDSGENSSTTFRRDWRQLFLRPRN